MELKILEERPNPLLKRVEYRFEVDHTGAPTPKRDDVRSELARLAKVPKERLLVEWLRAEFGAARSRGEAFAYQTKEALETTAREHILVRNGLMERPVKGPPAAPEEKPAPPAAPKPVETPPPVEKPPAPVREPSPPSPLKAEEAKAEVPKPGEPKVVEAPAKPSKPAASSKAKPRAESKRKRPAEEKHEATEEPASKGGG